MTGAWRSTITIEIQEATEACAHLRSTQDAAHYLLDHWTKTRTPSYCAAVRLCAKAIRGEVSDDAAYVAFMAAAVEAVSNRMAHVADDLDRGIMAALAESILAELKSLWLPDAPQSGRRSEDCPFAFSKV